MPLSFLTRRGSKKTPSKAQHTRDGSNTVDAKAPTPQAVAGPMTKIPTPQTNSVKRRGTASNTEGEDVFLNLAADDGTKSRATKASVRSRSKVCCAARYRHHYLTNLKIKSIPEVQKSAAPTNDTEASSSLRYLQSFSQRTTKIPEKRRPAAEGKQDASTKDDKASINSSRAPVIKPAAGNANNFSSTRTERRPLESYKTPSPERTAMRASELAYTTPEAFDAIRDQSSAGLPHDNTAAKRGWAHTDGLESEASTTAASTVWEELTELKARMRKLESSGSRSRHYSTTTDPSDRPKTATTTTFTTNSASRRSSNNDHLSSTWPSRPRPPSQDISDTHPLLHSALRKARLVIDRDVYTALEASSIDALQIATIARNDVQGEMSSAVTSVTADDSTQLQKQMVRKTDNLCRSLTELAIILCEQHRVRSPEHPKHPMHHRPASSDMADGTTSVNGDGDANSPLANLDTRRKIAERIERLQSRYQARNADSLPNRTTGTRQSSVLEQSNYSPWASSPLNRAANTNTHVSARSDYGALPQDPADLIDNDDDPQIEDKDGTIRGPQRAMTDNLARRSPSGIPGSTNHSPRDLRWSRDYTNRHPLPEALSPTIRKALEAKNSSAHSIARSDRTARPSGVNSVKSPTTVRANEVRQDEEDPLSPTSNSASATSRHSIASISSERGSTGGDDGGGVKSEMGRTLDREQERVQRPRRGSASTSVTGRSPRLPPSTGAGLAERLEAKRLQRSTNSASANTGRVRA